MSGWFDHHGVFVRHYVASDDVHVHRHAETQAGERTDHAEDWQVPTTD